MLSNQAWGRRATCDVGDLVVGDHCCSAQYARHEHGPDDPFLRPSCCNRLRRLRRARGMFACATAGVGRGRGMRPGDNGRHVQRPFAGIWLEHHGDQGTNTPIDSAEVRHGAAFLPELRAGYRPCRSDGLWPPQLQVPGCKCQTLRSPHRRRGQAVRRNIVIFCRRTRPL